MELTEKEVADWIERLKDDVEAPVTVQPSGAPFDPITKPATWRVGIYATAFFYIPESARARIAEGVPALHARFQALIGNELTLYQNGDTGAVSKNYTQAKLESDFRKELDEGVGTITGYDGGTKETSPGFGMHVIADFHTECRPGGTH